MPQRHLVRAGIAGRGVAPPWCPCPLASSHGILCRTQLGTLWAEPYCSKTVLSRGENKSSLASRRKSSLGVSCSGRLPTHADSTGGPWVKPTTCLLLVRQTEGSCGAVGGQSPLHKGLEITTMREQSLGMDEIAHKERTEKRGSRAEVWAISHVSVWANSLDPISWNRYEATVLLCYRALGSNHCPPPFS